VIWKDTYEHTFPNTAEDKIMNKELQRSIFSSLQPLCSACCVRVCPTQATFKRKDGVVMQDMHRCMAAGSVWGMSFGQELQLR